MATWLARDMASAWRRGERLLTEAYLNRHAELANDPESALRLINEELCLRQEWGAEQSRSEWLQRFPQWQAQLEVLFDCQHLLQLQAAGPVLSGQGATSRDSQEQLPHTHIVPVYENFSAQNYDQGFPEVGDTLGDFRLLTELGRGAVGRVFLAVQLTLAERPVVLKIAPCDGQEHLSLARLQHTHIVPLYAIQDFPARNLRALCMPYLGGTSLAQLLEMLHSRPLEERTGQHFLQALDEVESLAPLALPVRGSARQFLAQASYVQGVCWIGSCLADALQYAHERGLVHLDLKPANVLLSGDGQPLLLDFNLAREPIQPGATSAWVGGTPFYMSPEQRTAVDAVMEGREVAIVVDGRSDIYSLGLLLYEALGGAFPVCTGTLDLHRRNAQVSRGLEDILRKCLAPDPGARYADAAALAADLRRHLADQPLKGVGNRSLVERWRKWRRRTPHALVLVVTVLALLTALAAAGAITAVRFGERRREAEVAIFEGQAQLRQSHFPEAVRTFQRGLALTDNMPGSAELQKALADHLRRAQRAQAAQELHRRADFMRSFYAADSLSPRGWGVLETGCRDAWNNRHLLTQRTGVELDLEVEQRIKTDLLDLALIWAEVHVNLAKLKGGDDARRQALQMLDEAESFAGPSSVLLRLRQTYARSLELTDLARKAEEQIAANPPRSPWEHTAWGRTLLRSGNLELAAVEFDRALELEPNGFWPSYYHGLCASRRGRHAEAVNDFCVCIGQFPESVECFMNRGLAHAALGNLDQAQRDYDCAVRLQNSLAVSAHYPGEDAMAFQYHQTLIQLAWEDRQNIQKSLHNAIVRLRGEK